GVDGLLAAMGGPVAAAEDARRRDQLVGDLFDGEDIDPGRGQLDGQRDAFDLATHPADVDEAFVGGLHSVRGGARQEHPDRVGLLDLVGLGPYRRHGQRLEVAYDLAGRAHQLTGGDEDLQASAALEQDGAQPRAGGDDVFAVVQHQQQFASTDVVGQHVDLAGVGGRPKAEGGGHGVDDL